MNKQVLIRTESIFYLRKELWDDVNEYLYDYKEVIKQRESYRIPFLHQSPQLHYRKHLVDYLKRLAVKRKVTHCCFHLAVYLLDIFMDNHAIDMDKLLLVVNVCLLISAKMEENNSSLKIADINAALDQGYSTADYHAFELLILKFFNWYVMFPTAAHYTHYFMQAVVTEMEMESVESKKPESTRTFVIELNSKMRVYLDKVVDDVHFMQCYTPSKLAAGIIAAARLKMSLPSWTEQLKQFTGYCEFDIEIVLSALLQSDSLYCEVCLMKTY